MSIIVILSLSNGESFASSLWLAQRVGASFCLSNILTLNLISRVSGSCHNGAKINLPLLRPLSRAGLCRAPTRLAAVGVVRVLVFLL